MRPNIYYEYGFDLTEISGEAWHRMLTEFDLTGGPLGDCWVWTNGSVTVVAGNNPVTGQPQDKPDYASYIGIKGFKPFVVAVADYIQAHATFIKDRSPGRLDFIDEPQLVDFLEL